MFLGSETPLRPLVLLLGMKIGSLVLRNNLLLAPMVRVSDPAFRVLCREQGAGLAFTEMLYAQAIIHKPPKVMALFESRSEDKPLGVQLAGFEPKSLSEAVLIAAEKADLVDLNLGCPVPKAEKSGVGAVLLEKPGKVVELVKAMRSATNKPVTVKTRLLDSVSKSTALAKAIEKAGADAITVHGRTKQQKRAGPVDFEAVRQIKESLSIPVINNGGIVDRNSLLEIQEKTGCDGFMLARSAIGNPGIFAELQEKKGISRLDGLKRYLELCNELEFRHFGRIKQQCLRFCHTMKNQELHQRLEKTKKFDELKQVIGDAID